MTEFQSIFERYYPGVFRRALLILGNRAAAEDVAQEVFFRLWYSPPRDAGNIGGWLYTTAAHLSLNHLRGEKRRRDRETRAGADRSEAGEGAEEAAVANCEAESARRALAKLAERDRLILLMKFSGHSYRDIAAAAGVEKGSVGTLLARAQARFREEYESGGGGGYDEMLQFRGTTHLP